VDGTLMTTEVRGSHEVDTAAGDQRRAAIDVPADGVAKRVLYLYGLYMLLSNAFYLIGYYLLPEGFMRGSPQVAVGAQVASAEGFSAQLFLTALLNLGWMVPLGIVLNCNRIKGLPVGYVLVFWLGIIAGLIPGTNSFAASDLTKVNAHDGMALGLSIGGLEMLAYVLIVAATVRLGVYHYRSWWRWSGEWAPTKTMRIRDVRLDRAEWLAVLSGVVSILVAAYLETAMMGG
jgi:hypothetical protein